MVPSGSIPQMKILDAICYFLFHTHLPALNPTTTINNKQQTINNKQLNDCLTLLKSEK